MFFLCLNQMICLIANLEKFLIRIRSLSMILSISVLVMKLFMLLFFRLIIDIEFLLNIGSICAKVLVSYNQYYFFYARKHLGGLTIINQVVLLGFINLSSEEKIIIRTFFSLALKACKRSSIYLFYGGAYRHNIWYCSSNY